MTLGNHKVLDHCYFVVLLGGEAKTIEGAQSSRTKLFLDLFENAPLLSIDRILEKQTFPLPLTLFE